MSKLCPCGHILSMCHRENAKKWCPADPRLVRYEKALQEIANQDFRGNRSVESNIAYRALKVEEREK